jgi:hypothetical protein
MDTVVESRRGKLRGRLSDGVTTFQGVPYAAPPSVEPWDGVRDALPFGPKSPRETIERGALRECQGLQVVGLREPGRNSVVIWSINQPTAESDVDRACVAMAIWSLGNSMGSSKSLSE